MSESLPNYSLRSYDGETLHLDCVTYEEAKAKRDSFPGSFVGRATTLVNPE